MGVEMWTRLSGSPRGIITKLHLLHVDVRMVMPASRYHA